MELQNGVRGVFEQLANSLERLSAAEYCQPIPVLFNASIGQHTRHIIELFIELEKGYVSGVVNYEKRRRDYRIETDQDFVRALLNEIPDLLDKENRDLLLEAGYDDGSTDSMIIQTNYYREVAYNLEHTVHHMALIRVGINAISDCELPDSFGVASSTIKYRVAAQA